eukprot:18852-Heterococcus_DN1.PRE.1
MVKAICGAIRSLTTGDDTRKDFSGAYDGIKALVAAGGITLLLDAAKRYWPTTDSNNNSSNNNSSSSSSSDSNTAAAQQSDADDGQDGEVEDVQQREVAT